MPLLTLSFLDWLGECVESVSSVFVGLVSFVNNVFQGLWDFIKLLPSVVTMLIASIGGLPESIALFATLSITIAVVLMVLGRNNN